MTIRIRNCLGSFLVRDPEVVGEFALRGLYAVEAEGHYVTRFMHVGIFNLDELEVDLVEPVPVQLELAKAA